MQKDIIQLASIKLAGITTRTNNASEMDPERAKIGLTQQAYFASQVADKKIANRKNPNTTLCVYTDYESDFTGDYTYFIGEEVSSFDGMDECLERLIIPAQTYAKFTNNPGPMPKVCIDMWKQIWQMQAPDLGGNRAYIADFEIYDERSRDKQNTRLDIYVGLI